MSSEEFDTISTLFAIEIDKGNLAILQKPTGELNIIHSLPGSMKDYIADHVRGCLVKALDIPVHKLLISGLSRFQQVIEAGIATRRAENSSEALVPLSEFTLESNHNPHVDVAIRGKTVATIPFSIKVKISFKGTIAKVCKGRLIEIAPGDARASGEINIDDISIAKTSSKRVAMPGIIRLGDGIDLPK
jgi:hypothetical protein